MLPNTVIQSHQYRQLLCRQNVNIHTQTQKNNRPYNHDLSYDKIHDINSSIISKKPSQYTHWEQEDVQPIQDYSTIKKKLVQPNIIEISDTCSNSSKQIISSIKVEPPIDDICQQQSQDDIDTASINKTLTLQDIERQIDETSKTMSTYIYSDSKIM